jgi:hypothetical protein
MFTGICKDINADLPNMLLCIKARRVVAAGVSPESARLRNVAGGSGCNGQQAGRQRQVLVIGRRVIGAMVVKASGRWTAPATLRLSSRQRLRRINKAMRRQSDDERRDY